jgi:conjugal transfer pilus assembly protein TraF
VIIAQQPNRERLRKALVVELREWSNIVGAGLGFVSLVGGACWLVWHFALERPDQVFAAGFLRAGVGFVSAAAVALMIFVVRGLVAGSLNDLYLSKKWGRLITMIGAGILLAGAIAAMLVTPAAAAETSPGTDYCSRDLGTWFYCARPELETEAKPASEKPPEVSQEERELAKFEKFKGDLEKASKLAVWDPTPENVERFYRMQRAALNQSSLFSDQYRRLVWQRPDLDYSLKRPVNELGKRDWADTRAADRELFLKKVAGDVGLFYLFRGDCSACKVFSPIMRDFGNRYALAVKGVSVDGSANPYIGTAFVDRGQLRSWGIDNPTTPAILLFQNSSLDPRTGEVKPVVVRLSENRQVTVTPCMKPQGCLSYIGAGIMAQDDIIERIYVMLATTPGEDY